MTQWRMITGGNSGSTTGSKTTAVVNNTNNTVVIPVYEMDDLRLGELIGKGSFCNIHVLENATMMSLNADVLDPPEQDVDTMTTPDRFVVKSPRVGMNYKKTLEGLRREARILSEVNGHPNIIGLHGIGEEAQCLILTRCETTLDERIDVWRKQRQRHRRLLTPFIQPQASILRSKIKQKRRILPSRYHPGPSQPTCHQSQQLMSCAELVDALDYLHSKNIMHRDLKPGNIGFGPDGRLKLFDFGLAMKLEYATMPQYDCGCYEQSTLAGSLPYMAPEVALGEPYGLSADTYSLSFVIWEILCLKRPFGMIVDSNKFRDVILKRRQRPRIDPSWTPVLQRLLQDCWNDEPRNRPSMCNVRGEMRDFISHVCF